ncbi:hypothetical protein SLA2020_453160 [Shorea laevis]
MFIDSEPHHVPHPDYLRRCRDRSIEGSSGAGERVPGEGSSGARDDDFRFRQNRPPIFTVPPRMSLAGLLDSPGLLLLAGVEPQYV